MRYRDRMVFVCRISGASSLAHSRSQQLYSSVHEVFVRRDAPTSIKTLLMTAVEIKMNTHLSSFCTFYTAQPLPPPRLLYFATGGIGWFLASCRLCTWAGYCVARRHGRGTSEKEMTVRLKGSGLAGLPSKKRHTQASGLSANPAVFDQ